MGTPVAIYTIMDGQTITEFTLLHKRLFYFPSCFSSILFIVTQTEKFALSKD
jgi:hypothetical protein